MPASETFAPLADADWPPVISDMRDGFAGQLNVYRVMVHHPALLQAWQTLRNHVVRASALTPEQLELVILRSAHRWDSDYEWAHHVVRGRAAGLSDSRIAAAAFPVDSQDMTGDRLFFGAVDELVDNGSLSPSRIGALQAVVGSHGILDLMATVGMYTTLAFIVKSFATPVDADIRAALEHAPLV